jgi:hypothetical protein
VPGYANPQTLNRYSYVLNNPMKLTDPTGHKCVGEAEECEDENKRPINGAGGFGGGGNSNGGGGYHPPVVIPDLACGGMLICTQQTPYDYAASLLPFTSSDACYFLLHDPILCSSSSWQNVPSPASQINISIDALGLRIEGSGWLFGGADLNIDLLYFGSSNEMGLFVSPGGQTGDGGGFAITGGILIGQNLPGSGSYSGVSYTVAGGDIPVIPLGINVEGEYSISSPNANGTIPQTTYLGVGPLQPEVGGYSGANLSLPITGLWNWITGR